MEGDTMSELLYPEDVDQRLNWPLGRTERLARQRRLPYVLLPDGSLRFDWGDIERLVLRIPAAAEGGSNAK
jgi:hypothetical protein